MRRAGLHLLLLAALVAGTQPLAAAERLVVSLSTHRVLISSNFTGTDLVLFGAIEGLDPTKMARGGYDVVVSVRGPRRSFITRRKARLLGIWVNAESREFVDVPAYLSVSTNRAPAEIGPPDFLRRNAVGLANNMLAQRIGTDIADVQVQDPFRAGFLRAKTDEGLFREEPNGVTYLGVGAE